MRIRIRTGQKHADPDPDHKPWYRVILKFSHLINLFFPFDEFNTIFDEADYVSESIIIHHAKTHLDKLSVGARDLYRLLCIPSIQC